MGVLSRGINGILWMFSSKFVKILLNVYVIALLSRLLSPSEYGTMGTVLIILGFAKIFNQLGIGSALVQKKSINSNHISTALLISIMMGLTSILLIISISDYIESYFNIYGLSFILKVTSILFLTESLSVVSLSILNRDLKFKQISIIQILSFVLSFGISAPVLAYNNYGVYSLVVAYIIDSTMIMLLAYRYTKHSINLKFDISSAKELMFFGGGLTIATVFNYIAKKSDSFIVTKYLGENSLGIYDRALSIMTMPATYIGDAIDRVFFPILSGIQNDKYKLESFFLRGTTIIAFVSIPFSMFIHLFSHDIIIIMLGDKWLSAVTVLEILSFAIIPRIGYKISESITRAVGEVYKRAWRQIVFAIIVLAGCISLVSYGLNYVSYVIVFASFVIYLLMSAQSIKITDSSWIQFILCHMAGVFNGLILYFVYYYISVLNIVNEISFLNLGLAILVTLLYYIFVFRFRIKGLVNNDVVYLINNVFNKKNNIIL
jgi:O-antigen/teichoic acid export membrane protein